MVEAFTRPGEGYLLEAGGLAALVLARGRQLPGSNIISNIVSIDWFLLSQFTHTLLNLFLAIPCYKSKVTGLWVN